MANKKTPMNRKDALSHNEGPEEPGWYATAVGIAYCGPFSDPKAAWRAIRRIGGAPPMPGDQVFWSDGRFPAKADEDEQ